MAEINLRKEFEAILAKYGYNALLVREDSQVRCSCWNEKTQEASRDCPVCFGLGRVPVVEKHTCRYQDTSVPETLAMLGQEGSFGGIAVPGRFFFFNWNAKIPKGSLIVEVEWNEKGRPVYEDGGIFEVSHVDKKRFQKGQIIFQKVYVKDTPVVKDIRGIRIASVDNIINYELIEG
ncbi:structural protein [Bacillus phage vB_BauM_KLEB27-3]|nr:structural protein [Bacillus phage vB_BauM_KLEB27-3]